MEVQAGHLVLSQARLLLRQVLHVRPHLHQRYYQVASYQVVRNLIPLLHHSPARSPARLAGRQIDSVPQHSVSRWELRPHQVLR